MLVLFFLVAAGWFSMVFSYRGNVFSPAFCVPVWFPSDWRTWRRWGRFCYGEFNGIYPLVNIQKTIENGHL